jgi:hypothetical protein
MADFTLDTSGFVQHPRENGVEVFRTTHWPDLSPFAQGYVEALFESMGPRGWAVPEGATWRDARFSDLAPETLAAILRDCEELERTMTSLEPEVTDNRIRGMQFWASRQSGFHMRWSLHQKEMVKRFPPLTPYLDDTGHVRLREDGHG